MSKRVGPVDGLVGRNIRIFRKAKGLSQARLGSMVGVTFQQIQKYEKGANRIGPSRLAKIANVLEVPIGRLFDTSASSSDGHVTGEVVTDLLITPYAVQMLKAFAEIRNEQLCRSIAELTESLADTGGVELGPAARLQSPAAADASNHDEQTSSQNPVAHRLNDA